eukprot:CAMPEP_0172660176 /NCGR_PEP_ID=MMETSP1074-20121228/3929_1 /TAXON_ID=2916 /ORGANISM="Ceratium fusus, Strain PA161109" /LENGTH=104 /DNA_ID=CAMNT_0013475781 /DNA_START=83 /DNA_END=397 /DNA_ORIENTATION=+
MAMQRRILFPLALLVFAMFALLVGQAAFVGSSTPTGKAQRLRAKTVREVVPVEMMESSIETALAVQGPGFAANIVFVLVPVTFLITLYLQSERTKKLQEEMQNK